MPSEFALKHKILPLTFVSFKTFISLSLSTDANCSGAGAPITLVIP